MIPTSEPNNNNYHYYIYIYTHNSSTLLVLSDRAELGELIPRVYIECTF